MRITSLMVVLFAGLTLAGAGCGSAEPVSTDEQVSTQGASAQTGSEQSSSEESHSAQAVCPLKWTCNFSTYYNTNAQCTAACGANTCYREHACNGTCVCP
ncbi:hypothetical protein [Stigmatella aurantiaca]|uniref:Lipoprotein n=1 Tax=Stigmatella aurantiaca (strain DW4/3-1) TaxID=378806 RepID=E3G0T1_STIAD|nr:hypothetical protein [Stigmatella aurantiaca]ADO75029.1 uncharacterized protein STAUR_7273 [Stigmatella aurantiaca DW4/3-1]